MKYRIFRNFSTQSRNNHHSWYTFDPIVMARATRSPHGFCDVIQQSKQTTSNNLAVAAASSIITGTKPLPSSLQPQLRAS